MKTYWGLIQGSILVLLMVTIFYKSNAQCVTDPVTSLVRNGDFSSGNTGFISGYSYCNSGNCLYPEAYYAVGTNANFYHNNFVGRDHTTGTGNFMIVNGAGVPNTIVWRQTITVKAGTDYNFSSWVETLVSSSPARLQFQINGVTIGAIFTAPTATNFWQNFFVTWNSGTATTAVITILNQNTTLSGNDFGLDDISFIEICSTPIPDLGTDQTLCGIGTIILDTHIPHNSTTTVAWSDGTSGTGLSAPYTHAITTAGSYWVCVKDGPCVKTDTINIIANFSIDLGPDFTLCAQTYFVLDAGYTNSFTSYKWYKNNILFADSVNRTFTVRTPGTYKVEVKDASCSITRTDEVNVTAVSAIPNDGTYCPPAQAVFSVTPNPTGGFKWYDAMVGGNMKGSGNTLSLSTTGKVTMYAEDTTAFQYNVGPLSKFPQGYTNGASISDYIEFDAHTSFTLKSVTVFAMIYNPYESMNISVALLDNTGAIQQQVLTTVTGPPIVPADHIWPFTVAVGFNVPAGTGWRLSNYGTVGDLFWSSGASNNVTWSDYKQNGIITFKGMGPGYDYCVTPGTCFGYFYNWEIMKGNNCARVPVVASVNCPTPLVWLDFTVKAGSTKNNLQWKTASEKNVNQFIVERSFDGFQFSEILRLKATGNSTSISEYAMEDKDVNHSIIYYRIKEVDINGEQSSSEIKKIERQNFSSILVQPNPNNGIFTISVSKDEDTEMNISILNSIGQLLIEQKVQVVNKKAEQIIEMSSYPAGVYIVKVLSPDECFAGSFVKE